jgi:hypothetical protein
MKGVAAALLVFEAITVLLAGLLEITSIDGSDELAWPVFGLVTLLCIAGAATMRRGRVGWVIGSIAQVAAIGTGFVVPTMFFLGGLFGALWILTYVLDQRLAAHAG